MMIYILKQVKIAFILLFILTVMTGFVYPVFITGMAQLCFPWRANGSLIQVNGKIIGSLLIGQTFTDPRYFWGRPSATLPYPYNSQDSSGSNLSAMNPVLLLEVKKRVNHLQLTGPSTRKPIPVDLVTASASGLDPDISVLSAFYQVPRIARARGLMEEEINNMIEILETHSVCNILGDPRVNVLKLNLALDHQNGVGVKQ